MSGPVLHGGPHTRRNSYIAWAVSFLIWLVLELLGLFRRSHPALRDRIPWFTLSETVWALERAFPPLRILIVVFLGLLTSHFVVGTPLFPGLGH